MFNRYRIKKSIFRKNNDNSNKLNISMYPSKTIIKTELYDLL